MTIVSLPDPFGPARRQAACEMRLGCARRGYFSISSQVQPNDKGQYPDTYLNIGGGKWSKGVAFINGFNLVRPLSRAPFSSSSSYHGRMLPSLHQLEPSSHRDFKKPPDCTAGVMCAQMLQQVAGCSEHILEGAGTTSDCHTHCAVHAVQTGEMENMQ